MNIIDISVPLVGGLEPWPGDTPFSFDFVSRMREGASCNVGVLRSSPHNGTHVDAPRHVVDGATAAGALPLAPFIGPAVVVDAEKTVTQRGDQLETLIGCGTRVLLRWGRKDHGTFPSAVRPVPAGWIEELAALDVPLLGTDQPSVDPADSQTLDAHHACVRHGIQILENLVLSHVAPGRYELVAFPLRLADADASPVRAVLIERTAEASDSG